MGDDDCEDTKNCKYVGTGLRPFQALSEVSEEKVWLASSTSRCSRALFNHSDLPA